MVYRTDQPAGGGLTPRSPRLGLAANVWPLARTVYEIHHTKDAEKLHDPSPSSMCLTL